jgi:hypothetical protein
VRSKQVLKDILPWNTAGIGAVPLESCAVAKLQCSAKEHEPELACWSCPIRGADGPDLTDGPAQAAVLISM